MKHTLKCIYMVDVNNYRGISILPPIAKLFEKLIAQQIRMYFEKFYERLFSHEGLQ